MTATVTGWDPAAVEAYIRQEAPKYGIDPNTAVNVARTEGLNNPVGDAGQSFGPYQLYMGGGLGNSFLNDTGLNPSDYLHNWRQQVDWFLNWAAHNGWNPGAKFDANGRYIAGTGGGDHGASNAGISNWQGIGGNGGASSINVGPISIPLPPSVAGNPAAQEPLFPGGQSAIGAAAGAAGSAASQATQSVLGWTDAIGKIANWLLQPGHWWQIGIVLAGLAMIAAGFVIYVKPEVAQV